MLTEAKFIESMGDLISFRTVPDNARELVHCLTYTGSQIDPRAHQQILRSDISPILLAGKDLTRTPDVLFLVHADVVDGRDEQFVMRREGDLLYGRGSKDMKFAIPLGVALLNEQLDVLSGVSYMLAVTTDEEEGGFRGAQYLAKEYGLEPKVMIVLDAASEMRLVESSKGIQCLRIETKGQPAHSCRPFDGNNPVDLLIRAVHAVIEMFPESYLPEGLHGTTVYIDSFRGGSTVGNYSDTSVCEITITHPASLMGEEIVKRVREGINGVVGERAIITVEAVGEPVSVDTARPAFRLFKDTLSAAMGKQVELTVEASGSDARHFVHTGAEVLMISPEGGDLHGEKENVSVASSLLLYSALSQFMREYNLIKGENI